MTTQNKHDSSNDCGKCSNGYYRTQEYNSASCVACNAGKYLSLIASDYAGRSNCKICERSRYTNENARSSCKWCIAGKYISDHMNTQNMHDSSNDCIECPTGKYRSTHTSGPYCNVCQQSRYTNQNGRTGCKWCSAGKIHF